MNSIQQLVVVLILSNLYIKMANCRAGRILQDLDHTRGTVTTQQPSMSHSLLRSSAENLTSINQHPHVLANTSNIGISSQIPHVSFIYLFI